MNDKIFDLCELQLQSVIANAELSVSKVTESSALAMEKCSELSSVIAQGNSGLEAELCSDIESNFNSMLINMQFFDEFTQRVEHVQKIIKILKLELRGDSFVKSTEHSDVLLNSIKNIFSIRSEFDVMNDVFPEFSSSIEAKNDDAIELF